MPKPKKPGKSQYHHGNLREVLLAAALEVVREQGAPNLHLREVARRAGVSHAAPAHHFGDKAGLLTALATEGFRRFAQAQRDGAERGGSEPIARFSWLGWAYVMFAAENREYFEVMFRPELLRPDDAALREASEATYALLLETARAALGNPSEEQLALRATAAWAEVHGLSRLWLDGNLRQFSSIADLDRLAREIFALPPATPLDGVTDRE